MKKTISLILTLMLLFSLGSACFAAPVKAEAQSVSTQIELIHTNFQSFKQDDAEQVWSYTVSDLDHNGRLEVMAASIQGSGRYTNLKVWEVGEDMKSFIACNVHVPEGDSFPDVIANTADTYYVAATDTWNYMFDDNITVSPTEVMTVRSAVYMKSSNLGYTGYAYQQTEYRGNLNVITFTDKSGRILTPEDYNASVSNAFAGAQKSSTNFDWFLASEATSSARFSDSYAVFIGDVVPVGAAAASNAQPATVQAPAATPLPASQQNSYLMVTKSPTNESHKPGETALFVANASNWASVTWTFVAPNGGEYSWQNFGSQFPKSVVYGVNETTLTIKNVTAEMNGWSAYATFYSKNGQTARSNAAYLYISDNGNRTTAVSNNSISGVVTDPLMSTVTIALSNGQSVQVSRGICSVVYGDLVAGCSCTVYYSGSSPVKNNIYHVDIYGSLTSYTVTSYHYYCPNCDWEVSANATVCPHCGYSFGSTGPTYGFYCPSCYHEVDAATDVCPYCNYIFATGGYLQDGSSYHTYGTEITTGSTSYCPNCSHEVDPNTDVCPYCNYIFATGGFLQDGTAYHTYGTEITTGSTFYCPNCSHEVDSNTDVCPYCNYIFATGGFLQDGTAYNTYGTEITDEPDTYDYSYSSYDVYDDTDYSSGSESYNTKNCPNCYNSVPIDASVCQYCGYDFYGQNDGGYAGSNYYENEFGYSD